MQWLVKMPVQCSQFTHSHFYVTCGHSTDKTYIHQEFTSYINTFSNALAAARCCWAAAITCSCISLLRFMISTTWAIGTWYTHQMPSLLWISCIVRYSYQEINEGDFKIEHRSSKRSSHFCFCLWQPLLQLPALFASAWQAKHYKLRTG